ncbi:MAG TPA: EscU/YscU/HrcU family type III secretion system export apparatus switch protein [Anaeromyxobacteraceae bacterium]|nr:EscU/YscU/HrcU family type III secretion system export apparatus switch protein [Anaeromyxobacteraceae bacterium]
MSQNRTEQPTPRRLRQARRRGEVASSRDLSGALALLAGLAALFATGPAAARRLGRLLGASLKAAPRAEPPALAALLDALGAVAAASLPACAAAFLAAAAAGALQAGPLFAAEALAFRWERLDPIRGLRRLGSPAQLLRIGLCLLEVVLALLLAARRLGGAARALSQLPRLDPLAAAAAAARPLAGLLFELAALLVGFGLLDLGIQRRRQRRALMMTPEEVRRDRREEEGDPRLRAERDRLRRAAALAGPVAGAACVVVNPTHLAVALWHQRGADEAPRVLAKGAGREADRIRAAARRAGVPTVRDAPLARALFRLAEVGESIPEELFQAAATVLAHVYRLAAREVHP